MVDAPEQSARDEVDEALDAAVVTAGETLLQDPRRLRAVVADLVGRPGADHRTQVEALVAATDVWTTGDHGDETAAIAALRRRDVDRGTARWALGAIARHGATFASGIDRSGRGRPVWLIPGGVAAAVVALIAMIVLPPDPEPEEVPPTTDTSSPPPDTTDPPTTPPEPEIVGYLVDFEPTLEGDVIADREWLIRGGVVTGTVTLTPTDATGSIVNHRELIKIGEFTDPRILDASVIDTSATFETVQFTNISGPVQFTFEASLTVDEFDEADVRDWYNDWESEVGRLRPTDNDQDPASATFEALTESG